MKISDVADIINVSEKDPANSGIDIFVGLEHYDIAEPVIKRFGSTKMLSTAAKKFEAGDVLIARRNVYLQRASLVNFSGLTSGDSIILRVKKDLFIEETDYQTMCQLLPFVLNSINFWDYANTNADGTMSKRLSPAMLQEYEFDLPSLEEQKVLAEKLWAAYEVKQSYLKMIAATEEMVKAQFVEMFTDKGYPLTMIKSFADVSTGGTPSKAHPEYWNGDKPWVSAEDMKSKYVYDTCEKVTEAGYATCKIIPVDTLMYVCRGSIGVMAINKIECATNQSICRATCHNNVCNVEFLYHALMYHRDNIKKKGTGTSFKSLNQTTFSELEIELPPYDEQMKFVTIAEQADKSGSVLQYMIAC